ncbi:hypothetical protein KAFR_0C02620 [Kazachstania africana CBS 2517]|uniref:Inositolphosphotransferase Aur1/Ipt1 domain-containing protein n=1 Tax=Kazachstania africana (strain ATCC 22294 / BCRC 22015 / CBS 2517 / CECT 1963 / NBRC 1671 / NRRL Y-8276) TaxID=1071382 RepID=H2ASA5_KAZAF|nr:hypothetical protein KAFR_0C02620 [Kazachstania africana CBS 2517]CCF57255.1 hypothetical protein KAFR_0C02620 [Kazachstania africana CBS 2517]
MNGLSSTAHLLIRIVKSALNQRNVFTLSFNFTLNFLPVIIWLSIFNNAGLIPIEIRPAIHSKIAFYSDVFMFGDWFHELKTQSTHFNPYFSYFVSLSFMFLFLIILPLSIWYYIYYIKKLNYNIIEWYDNYFHFNNTQKINPKKPKILILPFLIPLLAYIVLNLDHTFASQLESNFNKFKDITAWFSYVILHVTTPILTAVYLYVFHPAGTLKCFSFALGLQNIAGVFTHLLFPTASPWFTHLYGINDSEHVNYKQEGFAAGLIRVDNHLGTHLNTNGFHLSPIVFGAVPSLHSAIAFQCFLFLITRCGSLKHRFISTETAMPGGNLQGDLPLREIRRNDSNISTSSSSEEDDQQPFDDDDYDVEEDFLRTKENSQFIKLYVEDVTYSNRWYFRIFNKGLIPKLLVCSYIILQWWATMYLDHHYRFDLFVGMLYSLSSFLIINSTILQPRVLKNWIDMRMGKNTDVNNEARTMGMRVFQGTKIEWFFDPLA